MQQPATADILERLCCDLHALVFDVREARSHRAVDDNAEEAERIAAGIRRAVRGAARPIDASRLDHHLHGDD